MKKYYCIMKIIYIRCFIYFVNFKLYIYVMYFIFLFFIWGNRVEYFGVKLYILGCIKIINLEVCVLKCFL